MTILKLFMVNGFFSYYTISYRGVDNFYFTLIYPNVEKLKITNKIKNKTILIFFIAPKFIFF